MAILKIVNEKGKYQDSNATKDVLGYIFNPIKSNYSLYGYFKVDPIDPVKSMRDISASFGKSKGIQLRHYVISFPPYEVREPIIVAQIADEIAKYFASSYQTVYAIHEDAVCLHIHLVCNSINYYTGERYGGSKKEYYDFLTFLRRLLRNFGINCLIIEHK